MQIIHSYKLKANPFTSGVNSQSMWELWYSYSSLNDRLVRQLTWVSLIELEFGSGGRHLPKESLTWSFDLFIQTTARKEKETRPIADASIHYSWPLFVKEVAWENECGEAFPEVPQRTCLSGPHPKQLGRSEQSISQWRPKYRWADASEGRWLRSDRRKRRGRRGWERK